MLSGSLWYRFRILTLPCYRPDNATTEQETSKKRYQTVAKYDSKIGI